MPSMTPAFLLYLPVTFLSYASPLFLVWKLPGWFQRQMQASSERMMHQSGSMDAKLEGKHKELDAQAAWAAQLEAARVEKETMEGQLRVSVDAQPAAEQALAAARDSAGEAQQSSVDEMTMALIRCHFIFMTCHFIWQCCPAVAGRQSSTTTRCSRHTKSRSSQCGGISQRSVPRRRRCKATSVLPSRGRRKSLISFNIHSNAQGRVGSPWRDQCKAGRGAIDGCGHPRWPGHCYRPCSRTACIAERHGGSYPGRWRPSVARLGS